MRLSTFEMDSDTSDSTLDLPKQWKPIQVLIGELKRIREASAKKNDCLISRFDRFVQYRASSYENSEKLDKAVKALTRNAINSPAGDSLLSIFMGLPDEMDSQPFSALSYGRRVVDPTSERNEYLALASHADALLKFFNKKDLLQKLLADQANAWGEETRLPTTKAVTEILEHAWEASGRWQHHAVIGQPRMTLQWLSHALKGTNPHRWYPSRQPLSKDAPRQTYIKLLAELNRHMHRVQHSAIATLANANLPGETVTADELRKAWEPPSYWIKITKKTEKLSQ